MTIHNAVTLHATLPDCLAKVVKRAEILYDKNQPVQREVLRVVLGENPAVTAGRGLARKERISMRFKNILLHNDLMEFPKKPSNQTKIDNQIFLCS